MPISLILTFVLDFGVTGVWLGLVAGLSLACVLLMLRFWRSV
jgi:MATE family multidrug resistance protein